MSAGRDVPTEHVGRAEASLAAADREQEDGAGKDGLRGGHDQVPRRAVGALRQAHHDCRDGCQMSQVPRWGRVVPRTVSRMYGIVSAMPRHAGQQAENGCGVGHRWSTIQRERAAEMRDGDCGRGGGVEQQARRRRPRNTGRRPHRRGR